MQIEVLKSKLHRATVTAAMLDYEGSISIDTELLAAAEMHAYQKVDIYNINNGARFSTYIIPGRKGEICLNGAAARMAQVGDRIIIVTFTHIEESEADKWLPNVVLLGDNNTIKEAGRKAIAAGTKVSG
ncbi:MULTISPECIES: aspartate 1-decarboxylase [Treponema]|jgi:aspartate 1-decarboxylase|uniref:Aspartate 1-decarboxylase n=1 Tax=Treponema saccharophilum DSM 2985 TaxID=907348 RepID=H7EI54_9SPIR|nr:MULTISPECIES: aspartate 1-decarboxylase [Treponema]EIC02733.1 L-aspartate 1-decarboxylase [Treponema saccharophilum DSM 2985]MBQ5537341.1 aspartate 1-decarboxylase [Treponema sp.]BDC96113.1 aspartate 1-decarboxylase [Treponema saccharophilum]